MKGRAAADRTDATAGPSGYRTRDRLRLRIPEKRKDLDYFLDLYEDLRRIPDITEVEINPITGSVLLRFPPELAGPVFGALCQRGLLHPAEEQAGSGIMGHMWRFLSGPHNRATDVRTVLLAILIALAIHQIRRGLLLVPAISILWYTYDLLASRSKEPALVRATTGMPPTQWGKYTHHT